MNNVAKKGLIIGGSVVVIGIIYTVYKKKSSTLSGTTILAPRPSVAGTPATGGIWAQITTTTTSLFGPSPLASLPAKLTKNSAGNALVVAGTNVPVITYDPSTMAYQETDGTWYLSDGTPLLAYDTNNGTYQEEDGTWYTFDGTALAYYNPANGNYVEQSDPTTEYNNAGTVVNNNLTGTPTS